MTTLHLRKSTNRSPLRLGVLLTALAWFAVSPTARAVNPAPDGGYPNDNTAEGTDALFNLTSGSFNTAIGFEALFSNTVGSNNTAIGFNALTSNETSFNNTAIGFETLPFNTTGGDNTAIGVFALSSNTTGFSNTAIGAQALNSNITGFNNEASGESALFGNTIGFNNVASGFTALYSNTTGFSNTASGFAALQNNTIGNGNTADGDEALFGNTTGNNNIALGAAAGSKLTIGNNNIDIGAAGMAAESNTIRIGKSRTQTKTFIAGIHGATVANGVGVIVGSNGQLGTVMSSARFKEAIKPMDKASEAILQLNPVTFRYKKELDPDAIPQFGLIAEQVEKINPDLVVRDEDGKVNTVRYEAVNAMLLNEFLKEHGQVQQLKATVAQQQEEFHAKFAEQQKQIEALTTTVRKVSERVELGTPAPKIAANED